MVAMLALWESRCRKELNVDIRVEVTVVLYVVLSSDH